MVIIEGGLNIKFPKMYRIKQKLPNYRIENIAEVIAEQLNDNKINHLIKPGMSIAVAVGSRGIRQLYQVVETVIAELKKKKAIPFIVPAMGSHGGATPEGQKRVLESYGITEKDLKVQIKSSMEVVEIGKSETGNPIFFDKNALSADGVIPINRIKVHTDFRGETESGLIKMLVIGLGKHKGATAIHNLGFENFHKLLPIYGNIVLQKAPILFGIALVEDAFENLSKIQALLPSEIIERERILLKESKEMMAKISIPNIELLIIDEIGKDISGNGLDPNIIGRYRGKQQNDLVAPVVERIIILGLTKKTLGNACGIGYADITVKNLVDKIDFPVTYTNAITAGDVYDVKIPVVMNSEKDAIALGVKMSNFQFPNEAKVVFIKNTLDIEEIMVSESIFKNIENDKNFDISSSVPLEMLFDREGRLLTKI